MSPLRRSHRPSPPADDFEDDDLHDDLAREAGQERIRQLVSDLIGRWHWLALGLILGLLGGAYYLSKAPKVYQARSSLLIKQRTLSVISRADQAGEMDLRSLAALNTVAERISRPELLQKVAARPDIRTLAGLMPAPVEWTPAWLQPWLGLVADDPAETVTTVPPPAALAADIARWIKISIRRNTRLLDIVVNHPVPEVAKTLANAIGLEYQAELTGDRSSGQSSSLKILIEESEATRQRLQTAQNAMAIYQRALLTLKELETRENTVADLSRRYLPKHPRMIAAQADLASYQQRFLSEFDAARNAAADREYWDSHADEWKETGDQVAAQVLTARRLLIARGNVLESEITSQTSVFNSLLTHIQEGDINAQAVESEMEINSSAQLPKRPVSPVKAIVLAGGGVGGIGFGVLLAMVFIRLDNKIHTVAQVERETGLATLAAIAMIDPRALEARTRKSKSKSTTKTKPKTWSLPVETPESRRRWDPMLLFREGTSYTTYAEMFRVLRASVSLLGDEKKRRITLFSSALPGEGKTLVSSNFALAAASQGKRTLLIDLDLRKPAIHKLFGMKRDSHTQGATEVLSGQSTFEEAVITNTGAEHLHLMLAGRQAPNPGELLSASGLEEFLATATAAYDLVVLDSAPLLPVPDTRLIASLVNNFCLVVRGDFASKGAVRRVISMLDHDQNLPSGIVFNGFSEKRRLIGQNYSYGNYQTNRYGKAYRYGYGASGSYGTYGTEEE
ncbi:MAG: polysaccharide biosynthesis tyrosine autokinase [Akkermansiaceae bacterium]|nr:polysaccharide biosynthesis tyrosine autokinase [Akkermansiaceae bacterium]